MIADRLRHLWRDERGFIGTTAAIIMAASAAASAGASVYGAKKSADIQGQTADKALDFQKQQSQLDAQRFEATQHANYNQYVNRVHGAQALGRQYGFSDIPDAAPYVPTPMSPNAPPQAPPTLFGRRAIGNYLPRTN